MFNLLVIIYIFTILVHSSESFKGPAKFLSLHSARVLEKSRLFGTLIECQQGEFDNLVTKSAIPVVVDFSADW